MPVLEATLISWKDYIGDSAEIGFPWEFYFQESSKILSLDRICINSLIKSPLNIQDSWFSLLIKWEIFKVLYKAFPESPSGRRRIQISEVWMSGFETALLLVVSLLRRLLVWRKWERDHARGFWRQNS